MNSGIYKIINKINGKILVGQTKTFKLRWTLHCNALNRNKHHNQHLQNAWNKYGKQNFKFEIILECPINKLDEEEIRLIKELDSMKQNKGYNLTSGGGRPTFSEAARLKMSMSKKGEKNYLFGKHRTKIVKEKISKAHKGISFTKQHVYNLIQSHLGQIPWNKGVPWSKEIKEKLKKSHLGQVPWNKGISIGCGPDNHFFGKNTQKKQKKN